MPREVRAASDSLTTLMEARSSRLREEATPTVEQLGTQMVGTRRSSFPSPLPLSPSPSTPRTRADFGLDSGLVVIGT